MSPPLTARKSVKSKAASPEAHDPLLWDGYTPHEKAWDELFAGAKSAHEHCQALVNWLGQLAVDEFQERRQNADLVFINQGITFSVYSDRRGVEKIFPFDLIPRPVAASEWQPLEAGLLQRIKAINLFLYDVYHDRRILREGVVPEELVLKSKCYRPEMIGFDPPGKQYVHVVGTDLVRDAARPISSFWKTMAARRRASVMCWKIAS